MYYAGKMGADTGIQMQLFMRTGSLQGFYFYRQDLKDIPVSGRYVGDRDIELDEPDGKGGVRGAFRLHFAESSPEFKSDVPLQEEVLDGVWVGADGKRQLPVHVVAMRTCDVGQQEYALAGSKDPSLVEQNVQTFYHAVLHGDRNRVADCLSFPLAFYIAGKREVADNRTAFLRYYDRIFTKDFVESIAATTPHHMFSSWRGIMLGNGEVWFDENGKATGLNN
ncbi:MAG TPA: hypothetical protein VGI16_07225 [Candidatus Acidoferrum sp.]